MRVLIVDDEQAFAEPLAQRLELRGIEAAVAGDAETALDMLSRQEWDLVFLDVCLPGMDGVSLLKLLQEHEPRPDVVMLSGSTSSTRKEPQLFSANMVCWTNLSTKRLM